MGIRIVSVDEAVEDNGLKALVYGMAGAGKTVLCASMNQPTIIISAEGGLLSLKKVLKEKPELKKLVKVIVIKTISDLEETLDLFKNSEERICNWICLDSISEIAEVILTEEKAENKDGRAAYGNLTTRCLKILRDFRDLPEYNVLMTAKMYRAEDDDGKTYFAPLFPGKGVGSNIPYLFDEVFALRVEEDEETGVKRRMLQTSMDAKYYAKDRSGELKDFEPANISKIYKKIHGAEEVPYDKDEDSKARYARKIIEMRELEESDEDDNISTSEQYWLHKPSGKVMMTEEETDISSLLEDDDVMEISEKKYLQLKAQIEEDEEDEEDSDAEEESSEDSDEEETETENETEEEEENEEDEEDEYEEEEEVKPKSNKKPAVETKLQKAQREMKEAAAAKKK